MRTAPERDRTARTLGALGALGPILFTLAWMVAAPIQDRYYAGHEYISALASTSAKSPGIMMAGFIAAGVGLLALGTALRLDTGRWGPDAALLAVLGAAIVGAGLLRADCSTTLAACLRRDATWHATAHGILATVIFIGLVAMPLTFARVHRRQARWRGLCRAGLWTSAVCALLFVILVSQAWLDAAGVIQRLFVTTAFGWLAVVGIRMARGRPEAALAS